MEKKVFFISCLVFGLLSFLAGSAQNPAEILDAYQKDHYRETVFLQPDKDYYLTGEKIRFKVYCLDRMTGVPSELSKVAYVELLNRDNLPVLQTKIPLTKGSGFGSLYLPTNIISENYILRCYTRWMRNDGPENYFHAVLPVINPFKKARLQPKPDPEELKINFYPETGDLINKLTTKVVLRSKDAYGDPVAISGWLVANDSSKIESIATDENGLGHFTLTPDMVNTYHVVVDLPGGSSPIFMLPQIKGKGTAMQIAASNHGFLVNIFCNDQQVLHINERAEIMVWQKGRLIDQGALILQQGKASVQLASDRIEDGIFVIGLFNQEGKEILERKVFKYTGTNSNISLAGQGKPYEHRAKVTLRAEIMDSLLGFDYALSVADKIPGWQTTPLRMDHYLLLDHALEPYVHGLEGIFDGEISQVRDAINDLLITKIKGQAEWGKIKKSAANEKYLPEYRGPLITGSIKSKTTGAPAAGILTYLSIPGKNIHFFATKSKNNGELLFEMRDFYNSNEVVIQNDYTQDTTYQIDIDNPFSNEYAAIEVPVFDLDEQLGAWIARKSSQMQIANAYEKYQPGGKVLMSRDTMSFYHEPDARYYLDDYTRFVVMEEVMREYIAGINVRKNRNGFHFMTIDLDRNLVYEDNPLILLDGVPIFDADDIMALDPLKIEKIETVKRRFQMGYLDCQGIVTYTSYQGDLAGYTLPDQAKVFKYRGLQLPKEGYNTTYPTAKDRKSTIPDFRSSLYWSPVKVKNQNIYTSDQDGDYTINICGINRQGHIITVTGQFHVE